MLSPVNELHRSPDISALERVARTTCSATTTKVPGLVSPPAVYLTLPTAEPLQFSIKPARADPIHARILGGWVSSS